MIFTIGLCLVGCRTPDAGASSFAGHEAEGEDDLMGAGKCVPVPPNFQATPGMPPAANVGMTPGALCSRQNASELRYPERIPYCERNVAPETKELILDSYVNAGLLTANYIREDIKIDHHVPLCAGGSNQTKNLWPQHKSVGQFTDPIEPRICALMKRGKMKQADAKALILSVKSNFRKSYIECMKLSKQLGINF